MKILFVYIIICMSLMVAIPAVAQQPGSLQVKANDITENWLFDQESLEVFKTALEQRNDTDINAIHLINQDIMANMIIRVWHFKWKKQQLKLSEINAYTAVGREDVQVKIALMSYTISTDDGRKVYELSHKSTNEKTTTSLVKPSVKGITVEIYDSTRSGISKKTFAALKAPYREAFNAAKSSSLLVGQKSTVTCYSNESSNVYESQSVVLSVNRELVGNRAWIVKSETRTEDGSKIIAFQNDKDQIVKMIVGEMEFVQCDPAVALKERTDPVKTISVLAPIDCWMFNSEQLKSLTMRLETKNPGGMYLNQLSRQHTRPVLGKPNQIQVSVQSEKTPTPQELTNKKIPTSIEFKDALKPVVGIESDSPEIIKCARSIVGMEKRPWQQALLLVKWVSKEIKATYDIVNGTALETLRSKRGDCSEDSVLFVALARSLHIPARQVTGWKVMTDNLCGHAWAEIYAGGRWIELDPTTSKIANATYVRKTVESSVSLVRAYIDEMQNADEHIIVDKNRPYWTCKSNVYINRVLGLTMTIPENLSFTVMIEGCPIPLPMTEGESPVTSIPSLLCILSITKDTTGDAQSQDPESFTMCIVENTEVKEVDRIASGGVFFGSKIIKHKVIKHDNTEILVTVVSMKEGTNATMYEVPLNTDLCVVFTSLNSDPAKEISNKLPTAMADLVKTIKLTKPDIGPVKTASGI